MTGVQKTMHSFLTLKGTNEQGKYITAMTGEQRVVHFFLILKGTNEQGKDVPP
jgi:hypothetical protein